MTTKELEDVIGRGPGDPDMHGYPGQKKHIVIKQSSRAYRVKVRVV